MSDISIINGREKSLDRRDSMLKNFSPLDFSGLILWLDSSDESTMSFSSGTILSQWRDKSGQNHHASNTEGTGPTLTTNGWSTGKKSVRFNGTSNYLEFLNQHAFNESSLSYTILARRKNITTGVLLSVVGSGVRTGVWYITRQFYDGGVVTFNPIAADTITYVNDNNNLQINYYANGVKTADSPRAVQGGTALKDSEFNAEIGRYNVSENQYMNGDHGEIIIYNNVKSAAQILQLHQYLAARWPV